MIKGMFTIFLLTIFNLFGQSVKLIRTIGDDLTENTTFFLIGKAMILENRDIVVADVKGNFLAKFRWDGSFIKKTGRSGEGPMEFQDINSLFLMNHTIRVYDSIGRRISIYDINLGNCRSFTVPSGVWNCQAIDENRYVGGVMIAKQIDISRMKLFLESGEVKKEFFTEYPIQAQKPGELRYILNLNMMVNPVFSVEPSTGKILVGFRYPANPLEFFVFNSEGKQTAKYSYSLDKEVAFPHYFLPPLSKQPLPTGVTYPYMDGIFLNQKGFAVALRQVTLGENKAELCRTFLLLFNEKGEIQKKIFAGESLQILDFKEDYFLARRLDGESERLLVYSIK